MKRSKKLRFLFIIVISLYIWMQTNQHGWKHTENKLEDKSTVQGYDTNSGTWDGVLGKIEETLDGTMFSYMNPDVSTFSGKPLFLSEAMRQHFAWPPEEYVTMKGEDVAASHVFVTSASSGFYGPAQDMISNVQTLAKGYKIVLYDLGLEKEQAKHIKSLCDVEYRLFNFSAYPAHVKYLHNYAFKPLIVAEMFKDHSRIFYIDTSVRLMKTGNLAHILPRLIKTDGILLMSYTKHSIFVATHPDIYKYFGSDVEKLKTTNMGEAGVLVIHRTKYVFQNILIYWVLCFLNKECAQPTKKLACGGKKWKSREYSDCHRFDQSVMSILLAYRYNFNTTLYFDPKKEEPFLKVSRRSYKALPLRTCGKM